MRNRRVKVWNGNKTEYLGKGTYVGDGTVYFIQNKDGSISSLDNAEEEPIARRGTKIIKMNGNPKIKLDNGKIVYGCQVWWEVLK